MNRAVLKQACEALWGKRYRADLARACGVHLRTAMRWDRGESAIPGTAWVALGEALDERIKAINRVRPKIVKREES